MVGESCSGVGTNGVSELSRIVGEQDLATSFSAFNLCYKVNNLPVFRHPREAMKWTSSLSIRDFRGHRSERGVSGTLAAR